MAMTGMRRGEVLGLRWVDVDLDRARLAVRRAYISLDGHGQFSPAKTRKSRRTIDLDAGTVQALRDWRKLQQEEADEWGGLWEDHGLVFTQENGRPLDPDHFSQDFVKLSQAAGSERIRPEAHAVLRSALGGIRTPDRLTVVTADGSNLAKSRERRTFTEPDGRLRLSHLSRLDMGRRRITRRQRQFEPHPLGPNRGTVNVVTRLRPFGHWAASAIRLDAG